MENWEYFCPPPPAFPYGLKIFMAAYILGTLVNRTRSVQECKARPEDILNDQGLMDAPFPISPQDYNVKPPPVCSSELAMLKAKEQFMKLNKLKKEAPVEVIVNNEPVHYNYMNAYKNIKFKVKPM